MTSCLSRVLELKFMHCHVLLYISCRMLKVFRLLLDHDIPVDRDAFETFKKIERRTDDLGDAFSLLKNRITDL